MWPFMLTVLDHPILEAFSCNNKILMSDVEEGNNLMLKRLTLVATSEPMNQPKQLHRKSA